MFNNVGMAWIRSNLIFLIFVGAVIVSFVVANKESSQRDRDQAAQLVAGCIRTSERASLNAAFQFDAAEARSKSGDEGVADKYSAQAEAMISTIPAPRNIEDRSELIAVRFVKRPDETLVARLTSRAAELQQKGCEQAYR